MTAPIRTTAQDTLTVTICCTTRASTKAPPSPRQSAVPWASKVCCRRPCYRLELQVARRAHEIGSAR